jgi:hypothetical protein
MQKALSVLVVLCLVFAAPLSAQASPEKSLASSPAMQELQAIMQDIATRAALADPAALDAAYRAFDVAEVNRLLGFTAEDYLALDARLTELRIALGEEFPELKRRAERMASESCGMSPSFAQCHVERSLQAASEMPISSAQIQEEYQDVDCQWGQYTAALALCTLGGPVWYWPCAYLALCAYCSGGWVSEACF